MDDLKSIIEYHEQAIRSIEDQLGRVVENLNRLEHHQEQSDHRFNDRMDRLDKSVSRLENSMRRAFRLGVVAYRRERTRRREEDERLEAQRARDRAEWQERMTRIERNLDRFIEGLRGTNGRPEPSPT